jgi:hypothetical protein
MSAGILSHDIVVATEPTWHKMERIKNVITFEESGLDWPVLSRPVFCQGINKETPGVEIDGYQEIVSIGDKGEDIHLSLMKSRYTPIQTKAIWDSMAKALEGTAHTITCTGSLQNRKLVFISVRMTGKDKDSFVINGDLYKANLNFLSSNDGSCEYTFFDSNTRVVCQNTFNMARTAIKGSKIRQSARHTKNNQVKIDSITSILASIMETRKVFKGECEALFKKNISHDQAYAWAVGFGFPSHREKPSAQVLSNAEAIASAFKNGDGNSGKNRYDLLNGVTQFFTRNTTRSDSNVYQSSFVGLGATRKGEAFDDLRNDASFSKTLMHGEKGLSLLS